VLFSSCARKYKKLSSGKKLHGKKSTRAHTHNDKHQHSQPNQPTMSATSSSSDATDGVSVWREWMSNSLTEASSGTQWALGAAAVAALGAMGAVAYSRLRSGEESGSAAASVAAASVSGAEITVRLVTRRILRAVRPASDADSDVLSSEECPTVVVLGPGYFSVRVCVVSCL
jgi:hypothetical protein